MNGYEQRITGNESYDLFNQGLDPEKVEIWEHICIRKGRKNAVSIQTLEFLTGIPKKRIQAIISHLVKYHKKPIGSICSQPPGVYTIIEVDDLERNYQSLVNRGLKILYRAARLKGSTLPQLLGQLDLNLEFEDAD
ncbi:MAG: hypothetical protein ACE5IH_08055 [Thermodesulfobacteriota bacterium]